MQVLSRSGMGNRLIVQTLTIWTTARATEDCDFSSHWETFYFPRVLSRIKGLLRPCLWSKSQPQKVNILKYILSLSTFVQHQARGSICSAFCLLSPAGAQRDTPLSLHQFNLQISWPLNTSPCWASAPCATVWAFCGNAGVKGLVGSNFFQTIPQTWWMFRSAGDQIVFSHQHTKLHVSSLTILPVLWAALSLLFSLCWLQPCSAVCSPCSGGAAPATHTGN